MKFAVHGISISICTECGFRLSESNTQHYELKKNALAVEMLQQMLQQVLSTTLHFILFASSCYHLFCNKCIWGDKLEALLGWCIKSFCYVQQLLLGYRRLADASTGHSAALYCEQLICVQEATEKTKKNQSHHCQGVLRERDKASLRWQCIKSVNEPQRCWTSHLYIRSAY